MKLKTRLFVRIGEQDVLFSTLPKLEKANISERMNRTAMRAAGYKEVKHEKV